ncbi:unnamed protein product [Symbiodinium natans]|uniref:Tudor domain-containing protein n=1 Tax=Symbiodinium natans TaxID=878477 RepID=A0A812IPT9_9DINO|nr:unnamed protein product [Symbiodinium natans]
MTARQSSYLPPSAASQTMGAARVAGAATALRLLECNPDSLLSRPLGGRVSAAKLARMQYQEHLEAKAGHAQGDLLDFEDGSAASEPSTSSQVPTQSRNEMLPGFPPEMLWAGDTVLARYGPNGRFFRARVVRVYSSRGSSLADVEWLRPQDGRSSEEFLGPLQDELHNRNGLQVGTEVRALMESRGASAPSTSACTPVAPIERKPGSEEGPAALPDLLDFSPLGEAAPSGDLLSMEGCAVPGDASPLPRLNFSGAGPPPMELSRDTLPSSGYGHAQVQAPAASPQEQPKERFDFVSDLFLQASDQPGQQSNR